eukprot:gene861-1159_t
MTLGLALGCAVGLATGILLAEAPVLRRLLHPYIVASQVVPKLALGPLFIVWFGFGLTPTIVITALICFFPLMENTLTGLSQVDPRAASALQITSEHTAGPTGGAVLPVRLGPVKRESEPLLVPDMHRAEHHGKPRDRTVGHAVERM